MSCYCLLYQVITDCSWNLILDWCDEVRRLNQRLLQHVDIFMLILGGEFGRDVVSCLFCCPDIRMWGFCIYFQLCLFVLLYWLRYCSNNSAKIDGHEYEGLYCILLHLDINIFIIILSEQPTAWFWNVCLVKINSRCISIL